MLRNPHPRLTIVDRRTISLGGVEVSYLVKRSQRARHARLEVGRDTGLVVVVPRRYRIEWVPDLVREKGVWVLRKLAGAGEAGPDLVGEGLESGSVLPYLGRGVELVIHNGGGRGAGVKLERGRLVVSLGMSGRGLGVALERWYRAQAEGLIAAKADAVSARLGLEYHRLTIRGQRTRWGSCSRLGNLSFNWKLMMVPEPVIDYVVVHEIAHLKEMNHSKRFWKLVADNCPRWREHRTWLKKHEGELAAMFYQRPA
jgi:predicted metal-dependent hydrolase